MEFLLCLIQTRLRFGDKTLGDFHGINGALCFVLEFADDGANLLGKAGALLGELADLLGDDGESAPRFACACRLDRGVEGEEVGLVGDGLDHLAGGFNLLCASVRLLHDSGDIVCRMCGFLGLLHGV